MNKEQLIKRKQEFINLATQFEQQAQQAIGMARAMDVLINDLDNETKKDQSKG